MSTKLTSRVFPKALIVPFYFFIMIIILLIFRNRIRVTFINKTHNVKGNCHATFDENPKGAFRTMITTNTYILKPSRIQKQLQNYGSFNDYFKSSDNFCKARWAISETWGKSSISFHEWKHEKRNAWPFQQDLSEIETRCDGEDIWVCTRYSSFTKVMIEPLWQ